MDSARKKVLSWKIPPERMGMVRFNGGDKSGSCPENLTRRDERVKFIGALAMEIAVQQ